MFHSLAAAIHSDPTEARNKTLRNELLHEFYSFRPNGTGSGPDAEDLMRQYYACGAIVNDVNLLYILCGVKRAGFLDRGVGFIWNMAVDGPLGMYVGWKDTQYGLNEAKRGKKEKVAKGLSGIAIGANLMGAQGVTTAAAFGAFAGVGTAGSALTASAAAIAFTFCMAYGFGCAAKDYVTAKHKQDMEYLAYDRLLKHYNLQQKIDLLDKDADNEEIARLIAKQEVLKNQALAIIENNLENTNCTYGESYSLPNKKNLQDYLVNLDNNIRLDPFNDPSIESKALYKHLQQKQVAKVAEAKTSMIEWGVGFLGMAALAVGIATMAAACPLALPIAFMAVGAFLNTVIGIMKLGRIAAKYSGYKKGIERKQERLVSDFNDENLCNFVVQDHLPANIDKEDTDLIKNYKARLYYAMQASNVSVSDTGEDAQTKRKEFYEQFKKLDTKHRNELLDSMLSRAAEDAIIREELKVGDDFDIDANISQKNRQVIVSDHGYQHHSFWANAKKGVKECLGTAQSQTQPRTGPNAA